MKNGIIIILILALSISLFEWRVTDTALSMCVCMNVESRMTNTPYNDDIKQKCFDKF